MKPLPLILALSALVALTNCSITTKPDGSTVKALDPAVTAAAVAIAKTPEGQALIDAAIAAAVKKMNPAKP